MAGSNGIALKCKEEGCDGVIDPVNGASVQIGCRSTAIAFPCIKCGRLHWEDGRAIFNRADRPAFLVNGRLAIKEENGTIKII